MKKTLLAAAAILSLSTAAMADPVKLSGDRLGDVAGGFLTPNVITTLKLFDVKSYAQLSNQDTVLAVGAFSNNVGAWNASTLNTVDTTTVNGL